MAIDFLIRIFILVIPAALISLGVSFVVAFVIAVAGINLKELDPWFFMGSSFLGVWLILIIGGEVIEIRQATEARSRTRAEAENEITSLVVAAKDLAQKLPTVIRSAESALDTAEQEFAGGMFAPFWDAVERAVTRLAQFKNDTDQIVSCDRQHRRTASRLSGSPQSFSVSIDSLPDPRSTYARLNKVVRAAQKDFQFSSIYEQRKTNRILVDGFSSLGNAIYDLGATLDSSIDSLAASVSLSFEQHTKTVSDGIADVSDKLDDIKSN